MQKNEQKQIRDALGNNRANREQESQDLYDAKKGKRNDNNLPYGKLKDGDFWSSILLGGFAVLTTVGIAYLSSGTIIIVP